jgi:hypothetical protein
MKIIHVVNNEISKIISKSFLSHIKKILCCLFKLKYLNQNFFISY